MPPCRNKNSCLESTRDIQNAMFKRTQLDSPTRPLRSPRGAHVLAVLLYVGFSAITMTVPADTGPDAQPMELEDLVQEMRLHNPQMEQALQNYLAAKAVVPQVLAPSNAQIGFIENPVPNSPFNIGKSQGFNYTLTQPFPFPGKKNLAGSIAQDQADIANAQTSNLHNQLLAQLKNAFYQYLLLNNQLEVSHDNIQRLEQIKGIAKIRYANNAAAYVDYLNAQVAQSSAQNDQFATQRQIDTVRETINTMIGRNPTTPLTLKGEIPTSRLPKKPLQEVEGMALDNHPSVKAASLQVKAAQTGVSLARLNYLPDFQVVLTAISDKPPSGFRQVSNYGVEFDVILPTWLLNKERGGLDQANANLLASRAGNTATRQQVMLNVDASYNALAQAVNQVNFIRSKQLLEAKTAYRLALTNYSAGGMSFSDMLLAQSNLRNTELALIQAQNNSVQAYTTLTAAVGTNIE